VPLSVRFVTNFADHGCHSVGIVRLRTTSLGVCVFLKFKSLSRVTVATFNVVLPSLKMRLHCTAFLLVSCHKCVERVSADSSHCYSNLSNITSTFRILATFVILTSKSFIRDVALLLIHKKCHDQSWGEKQKTISVSFSPQTNYTNRAVASCRQS
jgi:hypothetical protein